MAPKREQATPIMAETEPRLVELDTSSGTLGFASDALATAFREGHATGHDQTRLVQPSDFDPLADEDIDGPLPFLDTTLQEQSEVVLEPKRPITKIEKEVLIGAPLGQTTRQMARVRAVSTHTINNHKVNIREKLSARNFVQAVRIGIEQGVIPVLADTDNASRKRLSPTELEILDQASRGWSRGTIAAKRGISLHTLDNHRRNTLSKLQAKDTSQAVRIVYEMGIWSVPEEKTAEPTPPNLSPAQLEILRLTAKGLSSEDIGHRRCSSSETIKGHRQTILRKLGAKNTIDAVRIAFELGIFSVATQDLADSLEESTLTPTELEVLYWAARGLSNEETGQQRGRSGNTTKIHRGNILAKLGASNMVEAVFMAYESGILSLPSASQTDAAPEPESLSVAQEDLSITETVDPKEVIGAGVMILANPEIVPVG